MQEFGIQIELTMPGHNRTTTSRRTELLHLVLRMRGEMQLTNETILLDVEASDTTDNVKTNIQRHIKSKRLNEITEPPEE